MDPYEVVLYPVMTEVTSRILESENKLVFVVNTAANKADIKRAVEELYEVAVEKVNVTITPKGEKKAFVKLHPDYKAVDVAIKLGIL
ncbi:MAG: 50S ribosomal protein L23 [Candidatus Bathyarchaeota archaeon]|nr:MAG: 50S ribosomal protein L23 [Candidatus Bathyarchaeota archaeon]